MGYLNEVELVDKSRLDYTIQLLKKLINGKIDTETFIEELSKKQDIINSTNKLPAKFIEGLAIVAKTGSYDDLLDKPFIPVKTSELINDIKFVTLREVSDIIGEEKARAIAEEMRLNNFISSEVKRAKDSEEALEASINNEKTERVEEIGRIENIISEEVERAEEKEEDLSSSINNEKIRAEGKEAELKTLIEAEVFRAEGKENELESSLDTEKGRIDTINQTITTIEGDIDDLNERVDDIDGVIDEKLVPIETKLNTIEEGAQVNVIESISVNNEPVSVVGKNVDITIEECESISNEEIDEIWNPKVPLFSGHLNQSGGSFEFYLNRTSSSSGGTTITVPVDENGYWEWYNDDNYDIITMTGMFYNKSKLIDITFGKDFDTSNVTSMGSMFNGCSALTSIYNLSNCNTSNVTRIGSMFHGCSSLTSLDLSNWDTSKITSMSSMFSNCSKLTSIGDLSNWDTGAVTSFSNMFYYCHSLISLNMSNWNTSKVTTMANMFWNCNALTSVGDLSSWDTSAVTSLYAMFSVCSSLTSVGDLSDWNTEKVTKMHEMFYNCTALTYLKLNNWTTTQITSSSYYSNFVPNVSTLTIDYNSSKWNPAIPTAFANVNWNNIN